VRSGARVLAKILKSVFLVSSISTLYSKYSKALILRSCVRGGGSVFLARGDWQEICKTRKTPFLVTLCSTNGLYVLCTTLCRHVST
jgi:hypothetical protein